MTARNTLVALAVLLGVALLFRGNMLLLGYAGAVVGLAAVGALLVWSLATSFRHSDLWLKRWWRPRSAGRSKPSVPEAPRRAA